MTGNDRPHDFETQWQGKLAQAVDDLSGTEVRERVMAGGEKIQDPNPAREKLLWTCEALKILSEESGEEISQEVLTRCHCSYPVENLQDVKALYQETGSIDLVLDALQKKFEGFLRETLELEEELLEIIVQRGWGLAGVRDGERILATKIPKSGYLKEYFQTDDPLEKRRLYCHCPRVRDLVGAEPNLPQTYCYCGAGFYQGIWEEIIGKSVRIEVLESVMTGGDVCQIAIYI